MKKDLVVEFKFKIFLTGSTVILRCGVDSLMFFNMFSRVPYPLDGPFTNMYYLPPATTYSSSNFQQVFVDFLVPVFRHIIVLNVVLPRLQSSEI